MPVMLNLATQLHLAFASYYKYECCCWLGMYTLGKSGNFGLIEKLNVDLDYDAVVHATLADVYLP